jgi:AcrR family transcriptional regulator
VTRRPPAVAEPEPALRAAQARIVAASLELFAQRGVGGTSLQMIADAIGVTKAALFYQFRTKDDIVLAAAEDELARLEAVIDRAEAAPSGPGQREVLLSGIVDLAVDRRRTVSVILSDPVVLRFFVDHERYGRVLDRLTDLLMGPATGAHRHMQTAMFMAALSGAVVHPMMADVDDDTLRTELLRLAGRFHWRRRTSLDDRLEHRLPWPDGRGEGWCPWRRSGTG